MASKSKKDTPSPERVMWFDLETNGLLDEVTKVHSLVIQEGDTVHSYCDFHADGSLKYQEDCTHIGDGIRHLSQATKLIGHNIIGYDIPVLRKLYPHVTLTDNVEDTMILTRFLFGDIKDRDFAERDKDIKAGRAPRLPGNLIGTHKLEAWGYRMGDLKDDYTEKCKLLGIENPWARWNHHMQSYCEQDVRVTTKLWELCKGTKAYPESTAALETEHEFAKLIFLQQQHGFRFDVEAAEYLASEIRENRAKLHDELMGLFPPWYANLGPRQVNKKQTRWVTSEFGAITRKMGKEYKVGYYETVDPDCPQTKVELRVFNPASRHHIADRLKKLYGWQPQAFTNSGDPEINDEVLTDLPYPPAQALAQYFMLEKRLGQIADGNQAWLRLQKNGRIHGSVNTLGAVTHRCTHSYPNIAQVPSIENAKGKVPYGAECRSLFLPDAGHVLVGCDADALELRCLAHFVRDGGRLAKAVDEGKREDGTDIHTMNQKAAGLPTRNMAKTFVYGWCYGAGDAKIGEIVGGTAEEGKRLKAKFMKATPGLGGLMSAVKTAAKHNGYLRGIDGRRVPVRHQHAALNTLLQNAGAVAMKKANVILWHELERRGLRFGEDWAQVASVHDEWQLTCKPEIVETIKEVSVWAIEEAGRQLNFNCPLRGNAEHGNNWKETH